MDDVVLKKSRRSEKFKKYNISSVAHATQSRAVSSSYTTGLCGTITAQRHPTELRVDFIGSLPPTTLPFSSHLLRCHSVSSLSTTLSSFVTTNFTLNSFEPAPDMVAATSCMSLTPSPFIHMTSPCQLNAALFSPLPSGDYISPSLNSLPPPTLVPIHSPN